MDEPAVYYSQRASVDDREAHNPADWRYTERWPPPEAKPQRLYLRGDGTSVPLACEPAPKWDPACHAYNFLILLMKIAVEGGPDRRRSGPHPKGESISDNKALWRLSSGVPLRC
jgi:predicted acyl esterase